VKRKLQGRITTQMRPYQLVSLDWMLERETAALSQEEMHPLWRELSTSNEASETMRFYFNPYNGLVSSTRYLDTSNTVR